MQQKLLVLNYIVYYNPPIFCILKTMEVPQQEKKKDHFFKEILKASLIAIIIVVPIRFYVAQPYVVSGASMDPTFETGHYIIVDQLSYHFNEPKRGEVIVFKFPEDPKKSFIKRIIGLPHEMVEIRRGTVSIYNHLNPDGLTLDESYLADTNKTHDTLTFELGESEYFVMGDNRRASSDSRIWGALPKDLILGRAFFRALPVTKIDVLPGDYSEQFEPLPIEIRK